MCDLGRTLSQVIFALHESHYSYSYHLALKDYLFQLPIVLLTVLLYFSLLPSNSCNSLTESCSFIWAVIFWVFAVQNWKWWQSFLATSYILFNMSQCTFHRCFCTVYHIQSTKTYCTFPHIMPRLSICKTWMQKSYCHAENNVTELWDNDRVRAEQEYWLWEVYCAITAHLHWGKCTKSLAKCSLWGNVSER